MSARSRRKSAETTPEKAVSAGEAPAYLVLGDEYLAGAYARELVDRLCPPAEQALGLEIFDGRVDTVADAEAALDGALQGLRTMGFFGGGKTVWLRDATFFSEKRVTASEAVKLRLAGMTEDIKRGLPPGVRLVINAPGLDKRSALFKAIDAQGEVIEFAAADKPWMVERQARERVPLLLAREGLTAAPAVVDELIRRAGADTRQLAQEARKLAVYLGGRRDVGVEDVRAIVSASREAMAWDFADAVGNRDLPNALAVLGQLLFQGVNPMVMLSALESRFRELVVFKECLAKSWCTVRTTGNYTRLAWREDPALDEALAGFEPDPRAIHEFRGGLLAAQADKFSRRELIEAQQRVIEAHEQIVRSSLRGGLQMEFLVLRLLGSVPAKVRAS
jgi:DNA polymerase-3 subunit delta